MQILLGILRRCYEKCTDQGKTAETDITLRLTLEGSGQGSIDRDVVWTMLTLFAAHRPLTLICYLGRRTGRHTTIAWRHRHRLGRGICGGAGDRRDPSLQAHCTAHDEALILSAVDLSGRGYMKCTNHFAKVGSFDTELVEEFSSLLFGRVAPAHPALRVAIPTTSSRRLQVVCRSLREAIADIAYGDEIPSTKDC